jgi:hypothetical protein
MRTIETYRVFGLCVALASSALWLGCSDNNPGASTGTGGKGAGGGSMTGSPTTTSSTTTGTTTTGGTGGTGMGNAVTYCDATKMTWPNLAPQPITTALCSDFEDDAGGALGVHCIMPGGVWAIDTDKMGTPPDKSPPVLEACGGNGTGVHFAGAGHTGWGADIAAAVVSQTQPVDVSAYSGISFIMKSVASNSLIFKVQNPYSQPPCGLCTEGDPVNDCYSGYWKPVSLPAGSATPIVVKWTELTQQTWGFRAPGTQSFDPHNLISIAFAFDKNVDFDICLDDIKFVQ